MAEHTTSYVGIYDADGGLRGEISYVVGHMLHRRECALCDITHSPVRRKPAWDRMVETLDGPFTLLHRNELDADLTEAIKGKQLPLVLEKCRDSYEVALDAAGLTACHVDIDAFRDALLANRCSGEAPRHTDPAGTPSHHSPR
ncbi:hypothetical protein [Demequina flava]|uniref:hypothetical protein n=1 Tax=Demequina flava TaxID=1095025 RepID=UPI000781D05D|nr:hypothetical protein [Demequina flava]